MTRLPRDALASRFERYSIERRLHAVPPHEVHELTVDGRRAVLKVAAHPDGDPETEGRLFDLLGTRTALPVPEPLAVGPDWFVAGWLDGLPGETPDVDAAYAQALGRALGQFHAETADLFGTYGRLGADGTGLVHDAGTWHGTVQSVLADHREYLEAVGYGGLAGRVRDLLAARPDLLGDPGPPVVCHGNLLPEHVGFREADGRRRMAAVVDLEHALVGPPSYDLWRTALPVFGPGAVVEGSDRFAAFRQGYGSVRPFPAAFERDGAAHRLVNGVSYLRALDLQNGGIGPDEREQAERIAEAVRETVDSIS